MIYRSYHAQTAGDVNVIHDPLHAGVAVTSAKGISAISALKVGKSVQAAMKTIGAIVSSRSNPNQKLILSSPAVFVDPRTPASHVLMQPGIPVDFSGTLAMGKIANAAQLQTRRVVGMGKQIVATNTGGHFAYASTSTPLPSITLTHDIPGIGLITGVTDPIPGMKVKCLSHTLGLRSGVVSQINFPVSLSSSTLGKVTGQGAFSASMRASYADLGGLLVEEGTNKAVGIIYALAGAAVGNDILEEVRCCYASAVADALNIDFTGKAGTFTGDGKLVSPTRDPAVMELTPPRLPVSSTAASPVPVIPGLPAASDYLDFLQSSGSNEINIGGIGIPYTVAFGALGLLLLVVLLKK